MTRNGVITESSGNLLEADVEALVNTVNTVGVMGKGIALQFKRAYPDMFRDYARAAKAGEVRLGSMHVWRTSQLTGPRYVINFPTKGHWKSPSQLVDVERGLEDLVAVARALELRSLAVPPLGCGNGGLDWSVVEPLIRARLATLTDVDVMLFAPAGPPPASAMRDAGKPVTMSPGRAALVGLLAGEPLRLDFKAHHYGPYADNLRQVLRAVEGRFLSGFGDGSRPVQSAEPIRLLPGAQAAARIVLDGQPETLARMGRVLDLVEGFESTYGLELLATRSLGRYVWA